MKLRDVPSAAQGFDQIHACRDLLLPKGQSRLLSVEESGLGSDHIEVRIDAGTITNIRFPESSPCGSDRRVLLLDDLRQYANRSEIVLNLLESCKDGLPIIGHCCVIPCSKLLYRRAAQSAVEDRFSKASTDRPDARALRQLNQSETEVLCNPPLAISRSEGKKAFLAKPTCAFACMTARSSAAISGRRSSSADGTPTGTAGGFSAINLRRQREGWRWLSD